MKEGFKLSKIEEVRTAMYAAMKAKDKERKDALSMLLGALKAKAIDKREDLTEAEENSIIAKEIKQCKDTIEMSPADRTDIIDQCKLRIAVYEEFAPKQMSEDEIKATIQSVLDELGITEPTGKDRGKIMKDLMPKVKGKADGKLVNQMVASMWMRGFKASIQTAATKVTNIGVRLSSGASLCLQQSPI